jgi:hypothetical protein
MTKLESLLFNYRMQYAALMRGFDDLRYDLSNEQINGFLDEKERLEKLISILELAVEQDKNKK